MALESRPKTRTVVVPSVLEKRSEALDFFHALRLLECANRDNPRIGRSLRPNGDPVRLAHEPSLAFAGSTIASFEPAKEDRPPRLASYFFGLLGPNGPLPIHLTDYAYDRLRNHSDPTLARFLDLFHHRMLCLFYRAWANSKPTVSFDRASSKNSMETKEQPSEHADWFGVYVASLFGLGMSSLRGRDAFPDHAKLYYAGRLACQTRPPEGLRAVLNDFFNLPFAIDEFVGGWLVVPNHNRCRLDDPGETAILGRTAVLGSRVWEAQHKFRIILGPVGIANFKRFLPGSGNLQRLIAIVRNYVGEELEWDLRLVLVKEQVPRIELGKAGFLGWTTWLGAGPWQKDADDLVLSVEKLEIC